jgi:uncharacterized protein (DUF2141 family)
MTKFNALIAGLAGAVVLLAAAHPARAETAAAAPTGVLTVTLQGMDEHKGAVRIALFASEAGYDGQGAPVRAVEVPVDAATESVSFSGLAPGRYAFKMFHDINGNGEMDANFMGIPVEPFAFSNNAPARFGPAKWDAASFDLVAGANAQTITIR